MKTLLHEPPAFPAMPLYLAFKTSRAEAAAARRERFEQRQATRAVAPVVRGMCRFCHKPVIKTDEYLRGKNTQGYFHVLCDPERPDAVQKAVDFFDKLKAAPAVPGARSAGVQANKFYKQLVKTLAATEAAANAGASAGELLLPVPLSNGAADAP